MRCPPWPIAALALLAALAGCGQEPGFYAPCERGADCAETGARACFQVRLRRDDGSAGEGGICSRPCERDADCPEGGLCVALADDPTATFFCVARCERAADCLAPHACTPLRGEGEGLRACLP